MRVLIVFKKSFLELHGSGAGRLTRLDRSERARIVRADAENRLALAEVTAYLAARDVSSDAVFRGTAAARRSYDLVLSLGGDGTFFAAARYLRDTPIIGINSDPANSLGLWTCADRRTFRRPLDLALEGKLSPTPLTRLEIRINGKRTPELAFNDVLVASRNPAAMTRYKIKAGSTREDHRSSGIWVSTAAGSTAGIRSAGGRRMPLTSRQLQFLVREPYTWPLRRYRLAHGYAERLSLKPLKLDLSLWIDGSAVRHDLGIGDQVELRSGPPLLLLGYDDRRRRDLFP